MKTLIAIILVGIFPAMAIHQHYNTPGYTPEDAAIIAERFLLHSPTFSFDGMEDTIEVVEVETLRMLNTWGVTIRFTSRNGGYGDRTGQMVTTALMDHEMYIVVSNGKVTSAVTDGVFDELAEEMVNQGGSSEAEEAKELALEYMMMAPTFSFDGVHGSMKIKDIVILESYPVQYHITITFECSQAGYGDRTGQMLAQVITSHEARVHIVQGEVVSAIIDEVWDEILQRDVTVSELHPPEAAVTAALDYIKANYPEVSEIDIPEMWSVAVVNPDGLVGSMTEEYTGNGWKITINWAVVMEPVYSLEVTHGDYAWSLTVNQSLLVEEV